jgi:vitamin B12/bleomycin/antimicrobial peptide transport system ATP-binding/permease protein
VSENQHHLRHRRKKSFDRRLWRHFWQIAKPYWFGDQKRVAWGLLALLVLLLLGRTRFIVLFNEQSGEFTSALAAHDTARFWRSMSIFGTALLVAVPIYGLYYYVRDRLGIAWRRWLTERFLHRYLSHRAFYDLTSNHDIDNPDQRIAEDIKAFTQKSLAFLLEIVSAVLQLVAFSGVLWAISRTMVWVLLVYALAGTTITFFVFGRPMIGLNFQQLRREADFRFSLIRIRENAEGIAFYRGEAREGAHVRERFAALFENYKRLLKRTLGLNLFQYLYSFLQYALPSAIIAPRILSGELEVGSALQAGGAFTAMLGALTVFVDNFEMLSAFAAGIERLHAFKHVLDLENREPDPCKEWIERVESPQLELDQVTLRTPDHERSLVTGLSLTVKPGEGLLIAGASGGGKSSLLRAVAGLWRAGSGTIRHPNLDHMLFLPQRPYMIIGTLRHQLLYPRIDHEVTDAELQAVLDAVNLKDLPERCGGFDVELDFARMLSGGEAQRLAIARILLGKPRYAILDEATSALDGKNEAQLYEALSALDTTIVSVTHHAALLKYHRNVLTLAGDGTWALSDTAAYAGGTGFERDLSAGGAPQHGVVITGAQGERPAESQSH